jgi:DNA-binding NtrC family response regulator
MLRAQLIEEGFEVVATDTWTMLRRQLRSGTKPLLVIVDLLGLPGPDQVLEDLKVLMKPDRVVVMTAMGTVAPANIRALGFQVVRRPIRLGSVVAAAARTIRKNKAAI